MNIDTHIVLWILIVEIIDFGCTRWEFWREYNFDRGLVEKKKKALKPKEVVLAPMPDSVPKEETPNGD